MSNIFRNQQLLFIRPINLFIIFFLDSVGKKLKVEKATSQFQELLKNYLFRTILSH